jgi:hypothetical protein
METEIQLLLSCIRCERDKDISEFEGESDELYEQCSECREGKQLYNKDFLDSYCRVKEIVLVEEYSKVTRDTRIKGTCTYGSCREEFRKTFRQLIKTGGYCDKCTSKIRKIKVKLTSVKRYGVNCTLQLQEIKDQIKKTNLQRYGVENASQCKEVKDKMKKTNLHRYGVENSLQSKEVREKCKKTILQKYGVENALHSKELKEKVRQTNLQRYGVENASQCKEVKDKMKKTNLQRFGVEYASQSKQVREKVRQTNLERYGVDTPAKSTIVQNKMKKSNLQRFGVEYASQSKEIREKVRQTNLQRRGVDWALQCNEVKDKIRKTNLERYGVEHSMQNPEIADKSSKSARTHKDYTLPSGSVIKIQGYEHYALDELLQTYTEQDIITGVTNVPRIEYTDSEGKKHYHTPDIYIKSENRIIEVKSTWTFEKNEDNVLLKQTFAKEQGYRYEIWVYNGKGTKVEIYE